MLLKNITEKLFEFFYRKYINNLINKDFKPNQYLFFENTHDINDWAIKYHNYSIKIEEEYNKFYFNEGSELLPYMTIKYYAGYFHEKINNYLRGTLSEFHKSLILDEIIKRTQVLKNELKKFELDSNVVVIRRINNSFLKKLYFKHKSIERNIVINDQAFLSTSLDLFYRKDYQSNYASLKNESIMIIKVPKGINALYIEPISKREEFELLLNCDLSMKIEDRKSFFGNNIFLVQIIK